MVEIAGSFLTLAPRLDLRQMLHDLEQRRARLLIHAAEPIFGKRV